MTTLEPTSQAARPWRHLDRWAIVVLVLLALAPIGVSAAFGAYGLARNDDWAWAEILDRWQQTGVLRFNGWPGMFLIGHLALAWPIARAFPGSLPALELWTVALGVVGVLATYWTVRTFLPVGRAAVATALVTLSPLYAPLAMSFMTDVPSFAAQACCLALGVRALREPDARRAAIFTTLSFVAGMVGFTIREYAFIAPASVGLVLLARATARRDRAQVLAAAVPGAVTVVTAGVLYSIRSRMSGSINLQFSPSSILDGIVAEFGRSTLFTIVTAAFLVLPAFAFVPLRPLLEGITAARWRIVLALGSLAAAAAGLVGAWRWSPPILSPYLDERGTLGTDVMPGTRALLLPAPLFKILLALVLVGAVLVVVVLAKVTANTLGSRGHHRDAIAAADARSLLVVFVLASMAGVIAVGTIDFFPIFDRYLLATAPFAAALVLDTAPAHEAASRARRGAQVAAIAAFALLGLVWSTDSAAFDAARWKAGEEAVALGVPADRIEAGFEWRNVFRPAGQIVLAPSQPDPDACVVMRVQTPDEAIPSDALVDVPWSSLLGMRGRIVGTTVDAPGCSPSP
jgi:hypothetical protein